MRKVLPVAVVFLVACAGLDGEDENCESGKCDSTGQVVRAHCSANVRGTGTVEVEREYLPRVIACENGNGGPEALKAQAITARSYLYYIMGAKGSVQDSEGDQVYSCNREPEAKHYAAVEATSGQVLRHGGVQVAAFFVAGALQSAPSCVGGTNDPTKTQRFVTYNVGKSGNDVEPSILGLAVPENRGCMSQNGANCLDDMGLKADEIIRYHYGDDIEIVQAEGGCVVGNGIPTQSDEPIWIGSWCPDELTCGQVGTTCHQWYDEDPAQLNGFCTMDSEANCLDRPGSAPTFCTTLAGQSTGTCVAQSAEANGYCTNVPGTEARLMQSYVGDSGLAADYKVSCVPPDSGLACVGPTGIKGLCIDTDVQTCDGDISERRCPGASNIRCCTP